MPRLHHHVLLALLLAFATTACGGSEPSIKHRFPMEPLAPTPPEERQEVADAYEAMYTAQLTQAHLRFALDDIEYELKIARLEKEQARHEQKIAALNVKRSELAFQAESAATALKTLNALKKGKQAETEHIRYLKARRTYLRKELSYAHAKAEHSEAVFELAKAKLAAQRKTVPKGFKLSHYERQEKRTRARLSRREGSMRSAQERAKAKEQAWKRAGGKSEEATAE